MVSTKKQKSAKAILSDYERDSCIARFEPISQAFLASITEATENERESELEAVDCAPRALAQLTMQLLEFCEDALGKDVS